MSDVIDRLRAHDPERHGSPEPPPLDRLLALIDAEEARAARAPAAEAPRPSAVRSPRWVGRPRGGPAGDAGLTLPARAVRGAFVLGLAATVLAATLLVALGGGPAGGPPSLAPGSPASLAPIVHVRYRAVTERPPGRPERAVWKADNKEIGATDGPVDRWSTAAPMRWRELRRLVPLPGTAMPGGTLEHVYADGYRWRQESFTRGSLRRQPINPERWIRRQSTAARELRNGTTDPRAAVEELLANGYLRASSTDIVRDGRRLVSYVYDNRRRRAHQPTYSHYTYLLDAETFKPVEVAMELRPTDARSNRPRSVYRWIYEVYETLPPTEENLKLLDLEGPEG